MEIVECPHCATRVTNDGSLSGLVVTCPGCGQQFEMPLLPATPPSPPLPPTAVTEETPGFSSSSSFAAVGEDHPPADASGEAPVPSRKRKEETKGPPLWLAVLGSTVMFWLVVLIVLWATDFSLFKRTPPKPKPGRGKPAKQKAVEVRTRRDARQVIRGGSVHLDEGQAWAYGGVDKGA
jgi:hypothetical protein